MSDRIKLVRNDNRPEIELTLTDASTEVPIDVSGGTAVNVRFRKQGSTTVLATIPCTLVSTGTDGKVKFKFTGSILDVDPGQYEGEVEITYVGGDVQTVYELLKFTVRAEF